jgi:hypothetical protein
MAFIFTWQATFEEKDAKEPASISIKADLPVMEARLYTAVDLKKVPGIQET